MLVKRFLKSRRANVAPMFALTIVPVFGFVGAAVDYSRASAIRSEMQGALDATALMLSKEALGQTNAQLTTKADAYFKTIFTRPEAKGLVITASQTIANGSTLTVNGSGAVDASFTKLMGFSELTFKSSSTVTWGSTKLRVALALDNTGSMASSGKMTALKTATKNLLTQLQGAAVTQGDVYVSIVPFAKDVNVGKDNYTASWLDFDEWDKNKNGGKKFGTCSIPGNNSQDDCEDAGVCSKSQYTSKSKCTSNNGKWTTGEWTPDRSKWTGCVTDRAKDYDVKATAPNSTNEQTLFVPEQYGDCPTAILPLTYDWTALNKKVDDMQPAGNTNVTIGMSWGWQTLMQSAPMNAPALPPDVSQVVILLTDGDNTENRFKDKQSEIDARTKKACENAKAAGIQIYTVLVMQGNANLLKNCATSPEMFFNLTSANQLVGAFQQIGTSLAKLRIAK